jgi:prephenate dehydratase
LFSYSVVTEIVVDIEHALSKPKDGAIDTAAPVRIYLYPQALREHRHDLATRFAVIECREAADTGEAARRLSSGLLASHRYARKVYDLDVCEANLPMTGRPGPAFRSSKIGS